MQNISSRIFREYDIRGIVGDDITEETVELIGKAYGTYMLSEGKSSAAVGMDCRLSSPELSTAIIRGITSTGIDVVDIGMVTTPMLYFSLHTLDVGGGAMITASHNPPEYNGVKVCVGTESLYGSDIQKLRRICEKGDFAKGEGRLSASDVKDSYINYLKNNLDIKTGIKVAIDCANATAGIVAPEIFKLFGCDLVELYTTPDGTFPNHHPDPTKEENLVDLINTVRENNCELGVAFDGDADRLGVVDENGEIIWGDMLLLIYSRRLLADVPGATIIGEVKSSNRLYNEIRRLGGKAIMWKTGHSLIKSKMKDEGAELAGEMSGHIFFKHRFLGYDDGIYAALRLLEILSKTGKKVSELLEGIPKMFNTPEIRVDCPDEVKFEIVERVSKGLKGDHEVIDIDGLRIEFPDGWGLVRASNTQPALVMRFEAETQERLGEIRSLIESKTEEAIMEMNAN